MTTTINIAEQYTRFPGGRYPTDGAGNGTSFRERYLVPVLQSGTDAEIVLDGVAGYPSSFLDEAFGGLVREHGYLAEDVLRVFRFKAQMPRFVPYIEMIQGYIKSATPKQGVRQGA
jgi:hypothetical protein